MIPKHTAVRWIEKDNNLYEANDLNNCNAYIYPSNHQWSVSVTLNTPDADEKKKFYFGSMHTQAGAMELAMFFAKWLNFEG